MDCLCHIQQCVFIWGLMCALGTDWAKKCIHMKLENTWPQHHRVRREGVILLSFSSFYHKQIDYWHKIKRSTGSAWIHYWISPHLAKRDWEIKTKKNKHLYFLATGCVFCVPYILYVTTCACMCNSCAESETLLGDSGEFEVFGCCFVRMIND